MPPYRVLPGGDVRNDLDHIESFLTQSYQSFGDDTGAATTRSASRIRQAVGYMTGLGVLPHRGTLHPAIGAGLRRITHQEFVFYFEIDEPERTVTILAVFFGGADHRRQVMERLAGS